MIDITELVQALIGVLCAIITTFVIPWIKSKTDANKLTKVLTIIDMFTACAEQLALSYGWNGEEKKQYVVKELEKSGYTVSEELDHYIEGQVLYLHNELFGEQK